MKLLLSGRRFQDISSRMPRWCMLLGLFLLICGAKLWLINRFGNATPYWDQWDSEEGPIKAYLDGTFSLMQLFESHNEHWIAFTQMLMLSLFRANQQWDPILEMVAQAPIHAMAIVAFVLLAGKQMSNLGAAAVAGFAGCLTILPFGWQNTLWGDQSCFYFSLLFGIVTVWFCWRHEALTPRWWVGALLAFASLFTLASGVFYVIAVTAFLAARLILEHGKEWKRRIVSIIILGAIATLGVAVTAHLPGPTNLVASNFKEFLGALTGILSWPCSSHWSWIIIQAPLILLALVSLYRRVPFSDGRWFVIIVGAALWIHALATAYRRCKTWDSSRYRDTWDLLLIALCACLYFLHGSLGGRRRILIYPIAAVWISACVYGALDRTLNLVPGELLDKRTTMLEMENNVRQYLATGSATWLQGKIPYPFADMLQQRLSPDAIRRVLPSNLINPNPPLSPVRQKAGRGGFFPNGYSEGTPPLDKPAVGSYTKGGVKSKSGITLLFKVPRGTRQVDLQVAGYPNARGMALRIEEEHKEAYNIAPPFDPGDHWQTISVRLNRKTTLFKISAKDQSEKAWIAFSMPAISNSHFLGRTARLLVNASYYFIDAGLVLLALGALAGIANVGPAENEILGAGSPNKAHG